MAAEFRIGVVGAGYVGLVTGACLAHVGHRVTCVDQDAPRVAQLSDGGMPIYEPGLRNLVDRGLGQGTLSFTTALAQVAREADVVFIAVDTPQGEDGAADLSSVAAVAKDIGGALARAPERRGDPLIVVNKSTVPVGSGDYVSMLVAEGAEEANGEADYRVVSNPEFLREGNAIQDSLFPDRIVLGCDERVALDTMIALYEPILHKTLCTRVEPDSPREVPLVTTDLASAEMIKYAANAFLATKISFANEIAGICELVGADVASVVHGVGLDERIGPRFLNAGIGWGGSCFPKDVAALRSMAREYDHEPVLLDATVAVNDRQRKQVISKLQEELHTLKGKRVVLLGLAFKPDTDDLREAPSLEIARALHSRGARVIGYDPAAGDAAAERVSGLKAVSDPYEALAGAHAAVIVTEWEEIKALDLEKAASLMEGPRLLVDGRNAMDPASARGHGLLYQGFGTANGKRHPESSAKKEGAPLEEQVPPASRHAHSLLGTL